MMLPKSRLALVAALALCLLAASLQAAALTDSLKEGTPQLKSIGALAFGPEGVLFVADPQAAAIFAIDTGDRRPAAVGPIKIQGIDTKIAGLLGTDSKQISINDLAVNPTSGNAYLSISRGKGPSATPVLIRIEREGGIKDVELKNIKFAKAELPNAPSPTEQVRGQSKRLMSITGLAFANDKVYVAGLSNEEFASKLRAIPFPFTEADRGTSVEIFHGAHGKLETQSPVRTFVPYEIGGQAHLLAAYTCTPLVKFPISDLKPGAKIRGTTIAELGNGNQPLDMVIYNKDGKDHILMANSKRGVMKITTDNIDKIEAITNPVKGTAGLTYETIKDLEGVLQMDKLDAKNALVLVKVNDGLNLDTVALP